MSTETMLGNYFWQNKYLAQSKFLLCLSYKAHLWRKENLTFLKDQQPLKQIYNKTWNIVPIKPNTIFLNFLIHAYFLTLQRTTLFISCVFVKAMSPQSTWLWRMGTVWEASVWGTSFLFLFCIMWDLGVPFTHIHGVCTVGQNEMKYRRSAFLMPPFKDH